MRNKVKAPNAKAYEKAEQLLSEQVRVFAFVPDRLVISVGPLSTDIETELEDLGCVITAEAPQGPEAEEEVYAFC